MLTLASVGAFVAGLYALVQGLWPLTLVGIGLSIVLLASLQRFDVRGESAAGPTLIFVTKRQCTLCERARALLPLITEGSPFRVQEVGLETDSSLRRLFRDRVPVLLHEGEVVADLAWDAATVRQRLGLAPTPESSASRSESPNA